MLAGKLCRISGTVSATVDLNSFGVDSVCNDHQQQQFDYILRLLLPVHIHHFVRIHNREQKEPERMQKIKQNRKLKKVMNH